MTGGYRMHQFVSYSNLKKIRSSKFSEYENIVYNLANFSLLSQIPVLVLVLSPNIEYIIFSSTKVPLR